MIKFYYSNSDKYEECTYKIQYYVCIDDDKTPNIKNNYYFFLLFYFIFYVFIIFIFNSTFYHSLILSIYYIQDNKLLFYFLLLRRCFCFSFFVQKNTNTIFIFLLTIVRRNFAPAILYTIPWIYFPEFISFFGFSLRFYLFVFTCTYVYSN